MWCLWIYNPDWSLFKDTQKLYLSLIFHQVACILMLKLFWMQYWILSRIVNHLRLTLDLLISPKMPYCQLLAVMKIEEALVHQARVRWSTLKHCSCYGKKMKIKQFYQQTNDYHRASFQSTITLFIFFLDKMWIIKIKTELHTDIQQLFKT